VWVLDFLIFLDMSKNAYVAEFQHLNVKNLPLLLFCLILGDMDFCSARADFANFVVVLLFVLECFSKMLK
jgi:hypothetical protein